VNSKTCEFLVGIHEKYGKEIAKKVKVVASSCMSKHFIKMILKMLELDESNLIEINDTENYNIKDFLDTDMTKENKGKKFDICLMNPPFYRSLHLKFLEKAIAIADKVVSIQPVTWITDQSGEFKKTSNYSKYEETISKHIKDLEILYGGDATKYFGSEKNIAIPNDLGIYICDKDGGYNYKKENKFPYFLYKKRNLPFIQTTYENAKNKIFVPIRKMAGAVSRGLPAVSITQKYGVFVNDKDKYGKSFEEEKQANPHFTVGSIDKDAVIVLNSKEEAENFYKLCNSEFWKILCYKSTTSNRIPLEILPWPDNFKEEWTKEKLIKFLNLSDNDIKEYDIIKGELKNRLLKAGKTIENPI